jgi:hypothetical protein
MMNNAVMAMSTTKKGRSSNKRAAGATEGKTKSKAPRKRYSEKEAGEIVNYAKEHGYTAATAKYGAAYMTIKGWAERLGVDMSDQSRDRKKGSGRNATSSSSDRTVRLSPETIDSLKKAESLFSSFGFQTDIPTLVELAISHADFRNILEDQVESIRKQLQKTS